MITHEDALNEIMKWACPVYFNNETNEGVYLLSLCCENMTVRAKKLGNGKYEILEVRKHVEE